MSDILFMRGGDGKMYERVPVAGGDFKFVPCEDQGGTFQEVPGSEGFFHRVRDQAVHDAQHQGDRLEHERDSHKTFFKDKKTVMSALTEEELAKMDPREARQRMKRLDAYERKLAQVVTHRESPGAGPKTEIVSDNKFIDMKAAYEQAAREGMAHKSDFLPFSVYAHKLVTKSGKIIRHAFQGEVGMLRSRGSAEHDVIVLLQPGYGTGNRVNVPAQIESSKGEDRAHIILSKG